MDKKKADSLIEKLGMQYELSSLLDSDRGYKRFENAIQDCLKRISPKQRIRDEATMWSWFGVNWRGELQVIFKSIRNIPKAVEEFTQYFSIGCESRTYNEIAKTKRCTKQLIANHTSFIIEILKQNYKRQIWYGTL